MDLTKSSLKILLARFGGSVVGFLGTVYFSRELGTALFGTFTLFQALSQMLAVPADFGLQGAVIKRMSEEENEASILSTTILMLGVSLMIVSIVVFIFRTQINSYLGAQLAFFLITVVILNELSKLSRNVLKGELRVGETAPLGFARQITFNGLGAILLFSGADVLGLVYALIAGSTVVLLLGVFKWDTSLGEPSFDVACSLFDYSKFSVVSYVDSYLYNWLDVAVIGLLLTQSEVGTYEVAWRVSAVVMLFSKAIETTLLPQISNWDSDGSRIQIENVIPNAITASLFFIVPAFFGVLVLSQELLYYVFSPAYADAWPVLIILLGGKLFEGVDGIFKNVLSGMDRPDLAATAVLVSISLNVILNFTLVWFIGSIGAAIATTVSFCVSTAIIMYYLSNLITVQFPYREILSCLISSAVMAVALSIVQGFVGITSLPLVILFILLGGIIYISTIFLFPTIRQEIRTVLRAIIR
jgi:O-antigen/teichoic acid export membrane protein